MNWGLETKNGVGTYVREGGCPPSCLRSELCYSNEQLLLHCGFGLSKKSVVITQSLMCVVDVVPIHRDFGFGPSENSKSGRL